MKQNRKNRKRRLINNEVRNMVKTNQAFTIQDKLVNNEEILKIHKMSDDELIGYICEKFNYVSDFGNDNYWFEDNGADITLVSHIDTVFDGKYRDTILIVNDRYLINGNPHSDEGTGSDDRLGCYTLLKFKELYDKKYNYLFTNYEESGGMGVKKFIEDYDKVDTNMFIEFDRKGFNEYVDYGHVCEEVDTIMKNAGFTKGVGSYSDVSDLSKTYLTSGINMSVCYYKQHTSSEYADLYQYKSNISHLLLIIDELGSKHRVAKPKVYTSYSNYGNYYESYYGRNSYYVGGKNNNTKTTTKSYDNSYDRKMLSNDVVIVDEQKPSDKKVKVHKTVESVERCYNCDNIMSTNPKNKSGMCDECYEYTKEKCVMCNVNEKYAQDLCEECYNRYYTYVEGGEV